MTSGAVVAVLLSACGGRPLDARGPSSIMPPLLSHPSPAVAETIPTGVAAPDGQRYFVSSPRGIDALDPDTGATVWSTADASIPVLALPDTLLAIRGADPVDDTWTGPGTLVAIDLAAPHAARSGPPFELPLDRHRLLDVRIAAGALLAGWHARATGGGPPVTTPAALEGSLRIDLATGTATITEAPDVPDAVRQAVASTSLWRSPWRTRAGWSALAISGTADALAMTLRTWPDAGEARAILLLDHLDLRTTAALDATARRAFVRTCDPATPARCELRVYDAETGAELRRLADPIPDGIGPPFALVGDHLLAVQRPRELARARALIRIDSAGAAAGPRWRRSIAPDPLPDLRQ